MQSNPNNISGHPGVADGQPVPSWIYAGEQVVITTSFDEERARELSLDGDIRHLDGTALVDTIASLTQSDYTSFIAGPVGRDSDNVPDNHFVFVVKNNYTQTADKFVRALAPLFENTGFDVTLSHGAAREVKPLQQGVPA